MKYEKPALTFDAQADQLLERGLVADRDQLVERLKCVSYYRLSGYWYPFRLDDDTFREGTTFELIWRRYVFDRQLRLLSLDAIERFEVAVRTDLTYVLSHSQGAFGYSDQANLPNLDGRRYAELIERLRNDCRLSKEPFIRHFRDKYGSDHGLAPYWMVTELMTFGTLLTLFKGAPKNIKREIASRYSVSDVVLESWLGSLNVIRNVCAHHGRLWNRELGFKPKIPNKDYRWHDPVEIPDNRIFGILTLLKYLLNELAPQSRWPQRLAALLSHYPDIPLPSMGYPSEWESCPIWRVGASATEKSSSS